MFGKKKKGKVKLNMSFEDAIDKALNTSINKLPIFEIDPDINQEKEFKERVSKLDEKYKDFLEDRPDNTPKRLNSIYSYVVVRKTGNSKPYTFTLLFNEFDNLPQEIQDEIRKIFKEVFKQ